MDEGARVAERPEAVPGFVPRYDALITHPATRAEYGGSFYYNVGLWAGGPASLEAACQALVAHHVALAALDGPGLTVLDVGCGLGQSSADIAAARPDARVVGVNISAVQLALARTRFPGLAFVAADAAALPVAPGAVDRIVAVEAAFHFDPRTAFLTEAARVLAPGGRLVYTDVLFRPEAAPWEWWVPAANRAETLDGYAATLERAGLSPLAIEDVTAATWTPYCAHLRAAGREAADRIEGWVSHYLVVVAEPAVRTANGAGEARAAA